MAFQVQTSSRSPSPLPISHKADSEARVDKKRAPKACQLCRLRKVRCNMAILGSPCSNCKCDSVACVETPRKRRVCKKVIDKLDSGRSTPIASSNVPFDFETRHTDPLTSEDSRCSGVEDLLLGGIDLEPFGVRNYGIGHNDVQEPMLSFDLPNHFFDCFEVTEALDKEDSCVLSFKEQPVLSIKEILPEPDISMESSEATMLLDSRPQMQDVLPCYIRAIPEHLSDTDIEYLCKQGAFVIPDVEARDRLLGAYIEQVHPDLPLINMHEFWEDLSVTKPGRKASLMLLQATLLAASTCVDIGALQDMGFENRTEAVETFYNRTTFLYRMNYELHRPTLIQSLILLAYATSSREGDKGGRYWLSIAIGSAYQIGLNKEMSSSQPLTAQRLLRRIWWCCFVQDRLLALRLRTRVQIRDGDFNAPLIAISDFDLVDSQQTPSSKPEMKLWGIEEQTHIAMLFIQKVKLCFCIGHVVNAKYSLLSRKIFQEEEPSNDTEVEAVRCVKNGMSHGSQVAECDSELSAWLESLPNQYSWNSHLQKMTKKPWLTLHRGLLKMIYWVAVLVLHQPGNSCLDQIEGSQVKTDSGPRTQEACSAITSALLELYVAGILRRIPVICVPLLVPVVIDNFLDVRSSLRSGTRSRKYASDLFRILEQLSEVDTVAGSSIPILRALVA